MKSAIFAAILLSALRVSSFAVAVEVADDVRRCSAIDDSVKRLACYDEIAEREQLKANAAVLPAVNRFDAAVAWMIRTEKSKIDDSTSVYASARAIDAIHVRYEDVHPALYMRCFENTTALLIDFGGAFVADSGGFGEVTFRIDKQAAFTLSLVASTDHSALGLWSGGSAIPTIKKLVGGHRLLVANFINFFFRLFIPTYPHHAPI